jgi:hypothetical protein
MPIRLTALLLFLSARAFSQDANYWSSSYGPGAFLTPGATIANNGDSGVFFYNPALFGFSRKSSASISGTIYQYQSTNIKNGAGSGLDLKSSGGSVIPQMAANNITLKLKNRPFTIAYALLHEPVMGLGKWKDQLYLSQSGEIQFLLKESIQMKCDTYNDSYTHVLASFHNERPDLLAFGDIQATFVDSAIDTNWRYLYFKSHTGH